MRYTALFAFLLLASQAATYTENNNTSADLEIKNKKLCGLPKESERAAKGTILTMNSNPRVDHKTYLTSQKKNKMEVIREKIETQPWRQRICAALLIFTMSLGYFLDPLCSPIIKEKHIRY